MHSSDSDAGGNRGSVIHVALIVMTLLAMAGFAGFGAVRLARTASGGQMAAAAALHAAETGLAAHLAGTGQPVGSFRIRASWGEALVTAQPLVTLPDSSVVVRVESQGFAPAESAAVGRRRLEQLTRLDAAGSRRRVRGSWKEQM